MDQVNPQTYTMLSILYPAFGNKRFLEQVSKYYALAERLPESYTPIDLKHLFKASEKDLDWLIENTRDWVEQEEFFGTIE